MTTPISKTARTIDLVRAVLEGRSRLARWLRERGEHDEAAGLDLLTVQSLALFCDRDERKVLRAIKRLVDKGQVACVVRRAHRRSLVSFRWASSEKRASSEKVSPAKERKSEAATE